MGMIAIIAINGGRAQEYSSNWGFDNLDWGPRKKPLEAKLVYSDILRVSGRHLRVWGSFLPEQTITKADTILARSTGLALLNGWCTFRNETLVLSYLKANAYLIDLTLEAINEARLVFPLEISFDIEVLIDPESESPPHLFLLIIETKDPDQAVEYLETFYDRWWLDNLSRAKGMMTIGLLYVVV